MPVTRRDILKAAVSSSLFTAFPLPALSQTRLKPVRMLLNTGVSGPQAWFYLAQDRGYLAEEGLSVTFTPGSGAYTAAPRLMDDQFDVGYGDINSLIDVVSVDPNDAPLGVFATFNASPSTVAVRADGPIQRPQDLVGKTLVGHRSDVGLRTFRAFCQSTGLDRDTVTVGNFGGGFRGRLTAMLDAQDVDGVFGYVSTIASAMAQGSGDQNHLIRHLRYADYTPDLYGSAIMATQRLLRDDPETISALVRAFNKGIRDTVADPNAAIDAVMRRAPSASRRAQKLRLQITLDIEMGHVEGKDIGIGAVNMARLQRSINLIADTNGLSRTPDIANVFDDRFLPPLAQRVRSLSA